MTIFNDNPDMWPMLLLLVLLGVAVFGAMTATAKADRFKEESLDRQRRLEVQEEMNRELEQELADERTKLHQANKSLGDAVNNIVTLKREKGDLGVQVMALCKDVESLRTCNSDLHRVIDMDMKKLKEKDRQLAEQQVKIDKLMKVRKR